MKQSVRYGAEVPKDIRALIRPIVAEWKWLIPAWCRLIAIRYGAPPEDVPQAVATCEVDFEYRQARITICPLFREQTEDEQRRTVVHEILHVAVAPLSRAAHSLVRTLADDELLEKFRDEISSAEEGVVSDLMYALDGG